jgi:hypothetical protein
MIFYAITFFFMLLQISSFVCPEKLIQIVFGSNSQPPKYWGIYLDGDDARCSSGHLDSQWESWAAKAFFSHPLVAYEIDIYSKSSSLDPIILFDQEQSFIASVDEGIEWLHFKNPPLPKITLSETFDNLKDLTLKAVKTDLEKVFVHQKQLKEILLLELDRQITKSSLRLMVNLYGKEQTLTKLNPSIQRLKEKESYPRLAELIHHYLS